METRKILKNTVLVVFFVVIFAISLQDLLTFVKWFWNGFAKCVNDPFCFFVLVVIACMPWGLRDSRR